MDTPGSLLRQARTSRGLSLQELSSITRIPRVSLMNLENDAFEELPAQVFVRGFLRNVARELKLEEQSIIDLYEHHTGRSRRDPLASLDAPLIEEAPAVSPSVPSVPAVSVLAELPSLTGLSAPKLFEAVPSLGKWKMPKWDHVVEVVGSTRPSYVIGTLLLLLGVALTVTVMANGSGPRPNLTIGAGPAHQAATWDVKADGSKAPWIVKGQTSNLVGAATFDLSRPQPRQNSAE